MKQAKLFIAGLAIAVTLGSLMGAGFFDEAGQTQQSKKAWCAEKCTKQDAAKAIAAKFK